MTLETKLQFEMVNDIVLQAIKHGSDSGGSYNSNEDGLVNTLETYALLLDADAKVEVKNVVEEHPLFNSIWNIPQIVIE
jgi:hypothetical protein